MNSWSSPLGGLVKTATRVAMPLCTRSAASSARPRAPILRRAGPAPEWREQQRWQPRPMQPPLRSGPAPAAGSSCSGSSPIFTWAHGGRLTSRPPGRHYPDYRANSRAEEEERERQSHRDPIWLLYWIEMCDRPQLFNHQEYRYERAPLAPRRIAPQAPAVHADRIWCSTRTSVKE
jgi:hypothetical protein